MSRLRPTAPIAAAAALAGFACMTAELAAVRLQAPHFGDSAYVWTNVIGVILGAMALGATIGGRLAASKAARGYLCGGLVVAACLFGIAAIAATPLGQLLLPPDLPLEAAMPVLVRGSLLATTLLFGLPMLLLGGVAPLLIVLLASAGVPIGRAAGSVSAAGTLGSLAGTFASTHWLLPLLGCRWTLLLAGAALLLAAALLWTAAARQAAVVGSLLLLLGGLLPLGPLRGPPPGRELLAEVESRYQYLQVQREVDAPGGARTMLLINEGLDSFHSLAIANSVFTGGAYYDWHGLLPLWLPPRPLQVLSIGEAAGSLRRIYGALHPDAVVDGVDLDAATMLLGQQFFRGDGAAATAVAPGQQHALDGRLFLRLARQQYDVIHVDAYAHQVYVPAHLASREFFALAFERLAPDGILACNLGGLRADDAVLRAVGSTVAAVFGQAQALLLPYSRNALLVACRGAPLDPAALRQVAVSLAPADAEHWQRLQAFAREPLHWHDVGSGGPVLCDDLPLLDRLLERSYLGIADSGELVSCGGLLAPGAAELQAYAAAQRRDWPAVLATVAQSQQATLYLRELAGDARWSLRELAAAAAEYRAAEQLAAGDQPTLSRLRQKQLDLQADAAPLAAARQAARRNGYLAAVAVLSLLLLGGLLLRLASKA